MKIAFNPSTVAALIAPPNNKDITFDLRGHNIFARGVKFCGTDTNTWRDIKINNVSIGSDTLDLRDGDNTTLTNINGVVTINSTWRPVVDNLASDSTTSSLSANQGRILKALIDGKSDSDHNHDDRYLRLTGGWMSGDINFGDDNKIYWGRNTDSASISFKNDGDGDADSYMSFVTSDNGNEYFRWSHSSGSTNTEWMALRSDGLRVGGTKVSLEGHSHNDLYYTKTEVNNKLNGKSDTSHTHDDRYLKLTGGTMLGALNFANGTWNLVGDDSYMGDCNISGHFGIKAANTTYPGIAFFNNANDHLGNLTAYNGNIKYGAYSLQFLDNGNTSVSASTWMNPFSTYNASVIADGQAICVWGQSSYLSNLANDTGDMSLWLKRVNANVATLNMVLDGEYYANGNQRLAHVSEIPNSLKNPYALTISLNGTSQGPYDGSAAKNINITPSSIGAATSDHNHDGRYVRYYTVTTLDCNNLAPGLTAVENTATNSAVVNHSAFLYISDVGTPFQIQIPDSNTPYIFKRSYSSGKWGSWFKLNAGYADSAGSVAWDNVTGKPSSYTPSAHTHSWTSITDKLVAGNEFNIADAGFNGDIWFNYVPINDRSKTATVLSYIFGNGHQGLALVQASGFVKTGSSSSYVLLGDGSHQTISSLSVNYANSAGSASTLTVNQYLSDTDTTWWPLIWGGSSHNNTSDSTGEVYKSHDVLSWQTSSQTLYATHLQTTYIDLQNNRGISQVTSRGTSPYKGIRLPDLQSNGIGMFSKIGSGDGADEGGIIISADTSVIYNSFDTGWGLSVRDKDINQTDISGDNTIAFGIRQDYRAYSLGGFEKSGSDNSYVLLGGGGHKLESALSVANADTVDGFHYYRFVYNSTFGYNRNGPYYKKIASVNTANWTWSSASLILEVFSTGYSNGTCYLGTVEVTCGHWNNTDHNPSVTCRWILKVPNSTNRIVTIKNLDTNTIDVYLANDLWDCRITFNVIYNNGFSIFNVSLTDGGFVNLPTASSTIIHYIPSNPTYVGNSTSATNADMLDGYHANGLLTDLSNYNNGISITVGGTTKSVSNISVNYASSAGNADTTDGVHIQWAGELTSTNHLVAWEADGSALRDINPANISVGYASSAGNADTLDGYHENSFLRYRDTTSTNGQDTLWSQIGIRSYHNALPDGLSGLYTYGQVISFPGDGSRMDIFTNHGGSTDTVNQGLWWRSGWNDDKRTWRRIIDSGNIGSQSVNYANSAGNADTATNAYHLRINSANTWSTWYWAGQSGQPSWLWGSNDGTNMYVWDPNNFNVHTAQYLRSLGNQNCQTGRTQNYGDVYSYNTYDGNTGSPTTYSSVIGFGRGTAGTVEIAGGWCNSHLYWRSLRDCCDDWYSWRVVLDSSNYTEFINNYYWANVKISTSSSTTTSPTVSNLTATSSIKMGNILLEHTDEINSASGLHLNYRTSNNVSLCQGGGNVGIGTMSPSYKLDVNGQMRASGFHHSSMDSNNYMLLAGGGYKSFGGDSSHPIFLGYLNLDHGNDGTVSSSFYCLGYSVSFTYTRGGNYCRIYIPDTSYQTFYIRAATASVNYSGGGMDTWVGTHRGNGAWWLHCYASGTNEVRVKGFCQNNSNNDSWWGGNPLGAENASANKITVCIFGYVTFK